MSTPTKLLSSTNPFSAVPSSFDFENAEVIEMILPFKLFIPNAKGFTQIDPEMGSIAMYCRTLLEVIAYLGNQLASVGPVLTFELLPHKDCTRDGKLLCLEKDVKFVGIRVRLTAAVLHFNMARFLEMLFSSNQRQQNKLSNKQLAALPGYKRLDLYRWKELCCALALGGEGITPESDNRSISDVECLFNPAKALGLGSTLLMAMRLSASFIVCNSDYYVVHTPNAYPTTVQHFMWPFAGKFTYRVPVEEFKPEEISSYFFPHFTRSQLNLPIAVKQQALCLQLFGGNNNHGNSKKVYERYFASEGQTIAYDIESFATRCKVASSTATPQEQLHEFLNLYWREDNRHLSDALRSIIVFWSTEQLSQSSQTKDSLSNILGSWVEQLQAVCGVKGNIATETVITALLSSWQVYMHTNFHSHMLMLGPPGVGKSFILHTVMKLLIPGTFSSVSYQTLKAKTGATQFKLDNMIEIHEEILPSVLGVGTSGDTESLLKTVLTTGKFTYQTVKMQGHQRVVQEETIACNSVVLAGSNLKCDVISPAVLSRFNVLDFYSAMPQADPGVQSMFEEVGIEAKKKTFSLVMQRTQCLFAFVAQLIYCGVLQPIDMTVANKMFTVVLKQLKRANRDYEQFKDLNQVRHLERLRFLVQALVIVEAIQFFDTDNILNSIQPRLTSRVEHATIALGLLRHQYEKPANNSQQITKNNVSASRKNCKRKLEDEVEEDEISDSGEIVRSGKIPKLQTKEEAQLCLLITQVAMVVRKKCHGNNTKKRLFGTLSRRGNKWKRI